MTTKTSNSLVTEPPVWFITGCSTGFGLELARQAIALGYRTVMAARDSSKLEGYAATDKVLVVKLDVTQPDQVAAAIAAAQARFGGIDVLVNNAGIGCYAAIEEGEVPEVRKMFAVNVFGLSRMTQAVLPGMRKRRSGCIVNVTSLGGIRGMPSFSHYCATKFAVEGQSEALRREVEALGIAVMVVDLSGFGTDSARRSTNESARHIDDDDACTAGSVRAASAKQSGDPVRAVRAIVMAVASGKPPRYLLLGNNAFDGGAAKLEDIHTAFTTGEAVARAADFPKSAASTLVSA